ncbi:hypothetical protein CRYUN_Cryun13aG0065400 [Craigia yunnanensis]
MDAPQGGTDRDKSNPSSSPVSVVSNFWKEFDLEKEKSVLDEQGLRIAENQENSQKNRQKLAESTRDFKKASAEEKLSLFNSLLKGYQEEDDNLTKSAKFGENEHDLKISELESENRKMKVELEEFRTEAMHLKNQQATTRRFEERNHQLEQQVKLSEKTSLLETAEGKIVELAEKVNKQQKLIQKLEDDILKGYSSKERKGTLFDDWDLLQSGGNELS